jgi:glycerophosphoryl diester phosphodiesterase
MTHRVRFALTSLLLLAPAAIAETRACAHRGDIEHFPENTIPAIVSAARKRAPQIEFDVKQARDGQLVILHDPTLQRTSNGSGKVGDLTYRELLRLDFGAWFAPAFSGTRIPTLREVVAAVPPDVILNVHLDGADRSVAVPAAKLIGEMGRLGSAVFAATEEHATELRRQFPAVRICNMSRQGGDLNVYVERTIAMRAEFIQLRDAANGRIPEGLEDAVAKLHRSKIKVNYFGAQDEAKIRSLAAAGVDYILTDKLDLCMRVLAETARR